MRMRQHAKRREKRKKREKNRHVVRAVRGVSLYGLVVEHKKDGGEGVRSVETFLAVTVNPLLAPRGYMLTLRTVFVSYISTGSTVPISCRIRRERDNRVNDFQHIIKRWKLSGITSNIINLWIDVHARVRIVWKNVHEIYFHLKILLLSFSEYFVTKQPLFHLA